MSSSVEACRSFSRPITVVALDLSMTRVSARITATATVVSVLFWSSLWRSRVTLPADPSFKADAIADHANEASGPPLHRKTGLAVKSSAKKRQKSRPSRSREP